MLTLQHRYFDAVVLGRSVPALLAAGLLARRGLSVALLGGHGSPSRIEEAGVRFAVHDTLPLWLRSPLWRAMVHELALGDHAMREQTTCEPMFALQWGRDGRFAFSGFAEAFQAEVNAQFPALADAFAAEHQRIAAWNEAFDLGLERGASFPPEKLWQRLETRGLRACLRRPEGMFWQSLETAHPLRVGLSNLVAYGTDAGCLPTPGLLARAYGHWTRGPLIWRGGEAALEALLLRRLEEAGVTVLAEETARELRRDDNGVWRLEALLLEQQCASGAVITDRPAMELLSWMRDAALPAGWPIRSAPSRRYGLSLAYDKAALPEPLPAAVHTLLQVDSPVFAALRISHLGEESQVFIEALVPEAATSPDRCAGLREQVLSAVFAALPALSSAGFAAHSVYDGHRPWLAQCGALSGLASTAKAELPPRPMPRQWLFADWAPQRTRPAWLEQGMPGEPLWGPVEGSFLCGRGVFPAFGREGQLLAVRRIVDEIAARSHGAGRVQRRMWGRLRSARRRP